MVESAAALDGTRIVLGQLDASSERVELDERLDAAAVYLRAHPDFDSFDRFAFVVRFANLGFSAIAHARAALAEPLMPLKRVWPANVASVYDARHFDVMAYAPSYAERPSQALVELGRDLFFDRSLSGNGERSCASCHQPERGFTDGLARPAPVRFGAPPVARHTPRLINAALQPAQFADERVVSLEDQAGAVLASRSEMGSSLAIAAARVRANAAYRARIGANGDSATPAMVSRALAAYARSLVALDARFDRALRSDAPDTAALSATERRGFNLFMGKARCGTCHFAPLFNGATPPSFTSSEPEVIGVPARAGGASLDSDAGRGAIDRVDAHRHAFKTPTVRNAALGGPFMHNGSMRTLDDVLDFYDRGGGAGAGLGVPNQTLPERALHLTTQDKHDLIAFLGALVDTTGLTARPHR